MECADANAWQAPAVPLGLKRYRVSLPTAVSGRCQSQALPCALESHRQASLAVGFQAGRNRIGSKEAVAIDTFRQVERLPAPEIKDHRLCDACLDERHPDFFARLVFLLMTMRLVGPDAERLSPGRPA